MSATNLKCFEKKCICANCELICSRCATTSRCSDKDCKEGKKNCKAFQKKEATNEN